jgi:hypothetical protein
MGRLGRALDAGGVPSGAVLWDRSLQYGWEALAASFGSVKTIA